MLDRSSGSLYVVAAGAVLLFYMGPYRSDMLRVASAVNSTKVARSDIAEDRAVLERVASLRKLQLRVQKALRSPLQAVTSGVDEAGFLERFRSLSQRDGIRITTIVQGERRPADRGDALATSQSIHITATGKFARMLEFLGAVDSTVGLLDIDKIEMHPLPTTHAPSRADVQVQVDGLAIRFNHEER